MPTFYSGGVTVQLSTADVQETSTNQPSQRQCPETTADLHRIADTFNNGTINGTLAEDVIQDESTGSHFQWLGKNRDVPFMAVRAGEGFFGPQGRRARPERFADQRQTEKDFAVEAKTRKRQRHSANGVADASNDAHSPAFCLNVYLSDNSFVRKEHKASRKVTYSDLRIDVFLNGQLFDSSVVGSRFRASNEKGKAQIVRFTGQGFKLMMEKPWVLRPKIDNSESRSSAYLPQGKGRDHWRAVSSSLRDEIEKYGVNKHGERPIIGDYLDSLANFASPRVIDCLNDADGASLTVLDVVVVYGEGSRLGPETPYVVKPAPPELVGFRRPGDASRPDDLEATDYSAQRKAKYTARVGFSPQQTRSPTLRTAQSASRSQSAGPTNEETQVNIDRAKRSTHHLLSYLEAEDSPSRQTALAELRDRSTSNHETFPLLDINPQNSFPFFTNAYSPGADWQSGSMTPDASFGPTDLPDGQRIGMAPESQDHASQFVSPGSQAAANVLVNLSKPRPYPLPIDPGLPLDWTSNHAMQSADLFPQFTANQAAPLSASLTHDSSFQGKNTNPFTTGAPSLASSPLSTPPPSTPHNRSQSPSPSSAASSTPRPTKWVKLTYNALSTKPKSKVGPKPKGMRGSYRGMTSRKPKTSTPKNAENGVIDLTPNSTLLPPPPPPYVLKSQLEHPPKRATAPSTPKPVPRLSTEPPATPSGSESDESSTPTPRPKKRRYTKRVSRPIPPSRAAKIDPPKGPLDADFVPVGAEGMAETGRVGFAEQGLMRNAKMKRGGWFREEGVLVGMRFVLW